MEVKDLKKCTFVVAMREFFGANGKSMPEFAAELRDIKPAKDEWVGLLRTVGYDATKEV